MKISKKLAVTSLVAVLLASSGVYAASKKINIEVAYDNIKIVVNGKDVIFGKDLSGNKVEPFIYQGITYLPVRAVGEALGQEVKWDGITKTVYVGQNGQVKKDMAEKNMADLVEPFSSNRFKVYKSDGKTISLGGVEYKTGFNIDTYYERENCFANFNLENKYTSISGKLGADEDGAIINVKFIGDGNVIQEFEIIGGQLPIDVNLNVKGVNHFRIEARADKSMVSDTNFADVKIK